MEGSHAKALAGRLGFPQSRVPKKDPCAEDQGKLRNSSLKTADTNNGNRNFHGFGRAGGTTGLEPWAWAAQNAGTGADWTPEPGREGRAGHRSLSSRQSS